MRVMAHSEMQKVSANKPTVLGSETGRMGGILVTGGVNGNVGGRCRSTDGAIEKMGGDGSIGGGSSGCSATGIPSNEFGSTGARRGAASASSPDGGAWASSSAGSISGRMGG